jgi:hypothetical protein
MNKLYYLVAAIAAPIAFGAIASIQNQVGATTSAVQVTCDANSASIPTVIATLSKPQNSTAEPESISQKTKILAFLPEYFSPKTAAVNCQKTALLLQEYYSQGKMNYLASDTINGKPVVCAVERRGISCGGYSSEILFSLTKTVNPNQLLYDMLGENFKDSQMPSSRTVSRIYTDLRPTWWPF